MARTPGEPREVKCPIYEILDRLHDKGRSCGEFFDHLKKAKVELLLALRSLIDERVERLTKTGGQKPRARRIKVTEKG